MPSYVIGFIHIYDIYPGTILLLLVVLNLYKDFKKYMRCFNSDRLYFLTVNKISYYLDKKTTELLQSSSKCDFHYLSFGMFTLVFTEHKQHVVDMLCDTSVVNLRYIDALNEYLETSTHSQPVLAK